MAAASKRIRTPLKEHLRQMRYQLIPVLVFLFGIYAIVLLWGKHTELPNGIGAVKALRVDIVSPVDGVLVALPNMDKPLDMFDPVSEGQLICKFDDTAVNATIITLQAELKQITAQLAATNAEMKMQFAERRGDKSDRRQSLLDDARRLAIDLEKRKLDVADRTIDIETGRIALKRYAEKLAIVKELVAQKLDTPYVLSDTQLRHDVQAKELAEQQKTLIAAKALEVEAQARVDKFAKMIREEDILRAAQGATDSLAVTIHEEIDVFLKPIEASIARQRALVNEALLERKSLEIRVPKIISTGTIVEVYKMPGQAVRAGEPIMRIANLDRMYIVSYVRQPNRISLEVKTPVGVQVRTIPIRASKSTIVSIGPQIESIPTRQLRDPKVPEWGLPVKIEVPRDLPLTPGELVNITFQEKP
ncbi:MAG: HlyD family efflux transporter periplasmic adaptor subunit [Phycisphaerales bacterium]|jgi:multidrug resistance efflux pump|nr:HlyD family efflux transporter periplasmic adaptor subunit [Phycisphaerales bacterium]